MHFAPDMIYPYNPRQVVIYCGENDLVADTTLTAMDILNRTKQLINLIKANTKAKISWSYRSSPAWPDGISGIKNQEANRLIKAYCNTQKNLNFLDVWDSMLDDQKMPMKRYFCSRWFAYEWKGIRYLESESGSIWSNEMVFFICNSMYWMQRPSPHRSGLTGYDGHHKDYYSWWIYTSGTIHLDRSFETQNEYGEPMDSKHAFFGFFVDRKVYSHSTVDKRKYWSIPAVFIKYRSSQGFCRDHKAAGAGCPGSSI